MSTPTATTTAPACPPTPRIGPPGSGLPPRPRLVLRAGFAGSQRLLTDAELAATPLPEEPKARAEAETDRLVTAGRTRER